MKQQSSRSQSGIVLLAGAVFCCLLWGSAFSGVKVGYQLLQIDASDWASQMVFAGVRFFIAGIMALLGGSVILRRPLIPTRSSIPKFCIISLFQTILQYFFYYIGLAHTTGVKAAIIVGANVFTAILLSSLLFRIEKLTVRKIIGCCIGFAGIVLINLQGKGGELSLSLLGDGFIFLCTVASGFSSVFMKLYSADEEPFLLSGWQFTVGGGVMWLIGFVCGGRMQITSAAGWLILLYLAFVSAAAYSVWAMLLRRNPVSRVTVYGFLNPMFGVIISGIVLHEDSAFTLAGLLALLLVCIGIGTVNYKPPEKQDISMKNKP